MVHSLKYNNRGIMSFQTETTASTSAQFIIIINEILIFRLQFIGGFILQLWHAATKKRHDDHDKSGNVIIMQKIRNFIKMVSVPLEGIF